MTSLPPLEASSDEGSDLVQEMEGRRNRPGSEVVSKDPTTLVIENSNIATGACLTTENTSEGVGR